MNLLLLLVCGILATKPTLAAIKQTESSLQANTPVNVLVWDLYFDFLSPEWPREERLGDLGNLFNFGFGKPEQHGRGAHGLQVSYVILKDQPDVRVHLAYNPGIPWQDPEICSLTDHPEFQEELTHADYPPHPDCREAAKLGLERLNAFIRENHIGIVNISNGLFFDNYNHRNPYLLKNKYPRISMDVAFRFVYRNYLAVGKLLETVIAQNPEVLFVAAAGNNGDEVDRELFLKGYDSEVDGKLPVPTFFASFTNRHPNLVSVASSYDGERLAGGSNYGLPNVLFGKKIGDFSVPDGAGSWMKFGGTSAAAAETSRMVARALALRKDAPSPAVIVEALRSSVRKAPALKSLVAWGGFLEEDVFLEKMTPPSLKKSIVRASVGPGAQGGITDALTRLPVRELSAEITEFTLPEDVNPRTYGCHSLAIDRQGTVWMTMPWAGMFVSFHPATREFRRYPLPTPESRPDGISIDAQGRVWAGVHPRGGFVMLDPRTGVMSEYPHAQELTHNITDVDEKGRIWATGHQAKIISMLDPESGVLSTRKVLPDWPLDLRVGDDGMIWATGLKGYPRPWLGGALIRIDPVTDATDYFPLPTAEDRLQAYWVQPFRTSVAVTMMGDGLALFDRGAGTFRRYLRADGLQRYQIVRRIDDGTMAILNHHDRKKSIDFVDSENPSEIRSITLPNQVGEPREAIAMRGPKEIWYCQNFTNILARVVLP